MLAAGKGVFGCGFAVDFGRGVTPGLVRPQRHKIRSINLVGVDMSFTAEYLYLNRIKKFWYLLTEIGVLTEMESVC